MSQFAATVDTPPTRHFNCDWIVGGYSALGWNLAGIIHGAIPLTIEVPAHSIIPLEIQALDTSMHFDLVSTADLLTSMCGIDLQPTSSGSFLLAIIRRRGQRTTWPGAGK